MSGFLHHFMIVPILFRVCCDQQEPRLYHKKLDCLQKLFGQLQNNSVTDDLVADQRPVPTVREVPAAMINNHGDPMDIASLCVLGDLTHELEDLLVRPRAFESHDLVVAGSF